jgi:hypothetical protein
MRNAVIEFLKQELTEEQNQMAATPVIPMEADLSFDVSTESPWWPSMDSTTSTLSSPDLFNLATPASMSSSQAPTMSRQNSSSQPSTSQKAKPGLEDMTGVFSLSSTSQPKTRVRRKMTESEKLDYRKRRIVKACDSCSKRKRKCSHNQPEMEKVRSSKITKTKAPASNINSACMAQLEKAIFQPVEPSIVDEDPFMFLNQNMFSELPITDDFIFDTAAISQAPQQTTWPWSDTADWTLIDTPLLAQASPSYQQALFPTSTGLLSPQTTPQVELIHEPAEQQRASESPTATQTPTRTWRTFSDFSRTAFSTADGLDGKEQTAFMGLSSPGDIASPSQLRNTYSSMATLTGTQTSLLGSSATSNSTMSSGSDEMSPQLVPQAHGLTENARRPEVPRLRGTGGSITGNDLIGGPGQVISQQAINGQAGAGLRHVVTEDSARSPTIMSGDRCIGNSGGSDNNGKHDLDVRVSYQNLANTGAATSPEPGIQRTARTILPARSSAGISPVSANANAGLSLTSPIASDQVTAPTAEVSNHGTGSASKRQLAALESACHESNAASGEAPSAARPSSLSADSTSTSSSTSISRSRPDSPRSRPQAASPDLQGGLSAAAGTPTTPSSAIAHDKDSRKMASATQAKAHSKELETLTSSGTAASQAAATPLEPLYRHKRSPGQAIAPATSARLDLDGTRIAAAVLAAQVCMTWRALASAFVQALSSTHTPCRSNYRDCNPLYASRSVLLAA